MSEKEPHLQEAVILALREAWARNPEMRLTQLLVNVIAPHEPCPEIFSMEDSKLIKLLNRFSK